MGQYGGIRADRFIDCFPMKKGRIVNILLLIFLGLLVFTPVGFHTKVIVNRLISFNPDVLDEEDRSQLSSYNWQLQSRTGHTIDFNETRGKVVLINFWASWCPPCVAEMPDLRDLYSDYKEDVVFLFVARDEKSKIDQFLAKHKYEIPVYYELGQPPIQMSSNSLPTTYVISRKGEIFVAEKEQQIGIAKKQES